jgi:pimeloyl-ACP methyl ester carboxylesterase
MDDAISPDGIRIRFDVRGAGPRAIVFVHGWSCDRTYWAPQMRAFAERSLVVAVDLAGHGESGAGRRSWTMPAFGDDVVAIVEKLALADVVLVGHSMGGDVIIEAALRLGDRVRGLVWVDTYASLGEVRTPEEVEAFAAPIRRDFAAATRELVRGRLFVPTSDPELVERIAADMSAAPPDIAIDALMHAIDNDSAILAGLPRLHAPVVAVNGDYRPTDIESMARHGVKAIVMAGVAHFPMLEQPERFNDLLDEILEGFG